MTPHPQQEKCRLEGICYYCQSWGNCITTLGASCNWDTRPASSPPAAPEYTDKLVPPGTIISVDEDCNITRYDGSTNPCCHRPAMTFVDCHVGYLPHGECPKWNYNHRKDSQKFIVDVATIRNQTLDEIFTIYDSRHLIGRVEERYRNLKRKRFDYNSFYNGWIEGRASMLVEINNAIPKESLRTPSTQEQP